jgi:hypothetical protein
VDRAKLERVSERVRAKVEELKGQLEGRKVR